MTSQSYFPTSESEQVAWLLHYSLKLPEYGLNYGVSAQEIEETQADINFAVWVMTAWNPAIQQEALQATSVKHLVLNGSGYGNVVIPSHSQFENIPVSRPPGVFNRIFAQVQRIKGSAGYTESVGIDLGIIGSAHASMQTANHAYPEFSASVERGANAARVRIAFTKYQHDGVAVESRRNDGPWEAIGIALVKPWFDIRPLVDGKTPEVREYRLRWFDKNDAHGEFSPVQHVTVGP